MLSIIYGMPLQSFCRIGKWWCNANSHRHFLIIVLCVIIKQRRASKWSNLIIPVLLIVGYSVHTGCVVVLAENKKEPQILMNTSSIPAAHLSGLPVVLWEINLASYSLFVCLFKTHTYRKYVHIRYPEETHGHQDKRSYVTRI